MKKLILAMAFVFLLTGCQNRQNAKIEDKKNSNVATEQNNNDKENSKTDESKKEDSSESKDNKADATITVSPEEAVKKFSDKYPGVKIDEFSFGKENMTYCYEINGFDDDSEYEFEIDAADGAILKDNKELDNTADKMEINLNLISEIQPLIDSSLSEAGSDYHLDSYSVDFEKTGNFNKLDIELEKSKGQEIEFEYNLDTKELIKKDI